MQVEVINWFTQSFTRYPPKFSCPQLLENEPKGKNEIQEYKRSGIVLEAE